MSADQKFNKLQLDFDFGRPFYATPVMKRSRKLIKTVSSWYDTASHSWLETRRERGREGGARGLGEIKRVVLRVYNNYEELVP